MLKGEFEMYTFEVRPVKAAGTRWIDHRLRGIDRLLVFT